MFAWTSPAIGWGLMAMLLVSQGSGASAVPHGHLHARSNGEGGQPGSTRGSRNEERDDSLRSAMDALLMRQRQMDEAARQGNEPKVWPGLKEALPPGYGNSIEEITFYPSGFEKESSEPYYDRENGPVYRQSLFRDHSNWNPADKRATAFRERMSGTKAHPRDELAELFLRNIEEDEARLRQYQRQQELDHEYREIVDDLFQKFQNREYEEPEQDLAGIFGERNEVKRQLAGDYQPVGWGPVGFKKRSSRDRYVEDVTENDLMRMLKYVPTEALERLLMEEENANNDLQVMNQQPHRDNYASYTGKELGYWRNGDQSMRMKRFPVTKRSNVFVGNKRKRSSNPNKSTTVAQDKVDKDLSSIFGSKVKKEKSEDKSKKTPVKKSAKQTKVVVEKHNGTDGHDHTHYGEVLKMDQILPDKGVQVTKKAVKWTDYFGIDKRNREQVEPRRIEISRKYSEDSLRDINDMRQDEYPLRSFKHHDVQVEKKYFPFDTRMFHHGREQELEGNGADYEDADEKLKDMEDILVNQAVTYLGDDLPAMSPEEMDQLREMIIAKLTEAYEEEQAHPSRIRINVPQRNHASGVAVNKDKRVAVKKESAEHENAERESAHNETTEDKVKRGNEDLESYSEGYMGGRQAMHSAPAIEMNECPILQSVTSRCRKIDAWAGDRGQLFLPLCSLHQICYICGTTGNGGCDLLYLSEAESLCSGDRDCARAARSALSLMRELHATPDPAGECARHPCLAEYKRKR